MLLVLFTRQPSLQPLADASHPYPATRIAFQPTSLEDTSSSSSILNSSRGGNERSYGAAYEKGQSDRYDEQPVYPDRELLATTADCLRIWECTKEEEEAPGSGYIGIPQNSVYPFTLREKSVLAHVGAVINRVYPY